MKARTLYRLEQQLLELYVVIEDFKKQNPNHNIADYHRPGKTAAALKRKSLEVSLLLTDLRMGR
jgi:hypothetical protein